MKKIQLFSLCAALSLTSAPLFAEQMPAGPETSVNVTLNDIAQVDDLLVVNLTVSTSGVEMPSKLKTLYVPVITNETDTACFDSFAVTGRKRWTHDLEDNHCSPVSFMGWGKEPGSLLTPQSGNGYSVTPQGGNTYALQLSMPYSEWMGDAVFGIDCLNYGCTVCVKSYDMVEQQFFPLGQTDFLPLVFEPEIQYLTPAAEAVKMRNLVSQAFLDFKVNQTNLLPNYMNNPRELKKMKATVDSIQNDPDIKVASMNIHGYASPEGPYENNVKLAKGRTDALKNYVQKLYKFPNDFITTSYEPAINWEGLRAWLQSDDCKAHSADVANAAEILEIVNSDLGDFDRNQKIKTTYPTQYNWLLKNVYPSLRVSEYTLVYEVRAYDRVEEILEVMEVAPDKLSVAELFMAGSSNGQDTDVFAQSVELAVQTYPEDATANLNAGMLAMKNGNLDAAGKYLAKAGDSDEAKLARAQLDALKGENEKALNAFKSLEKSGNASVASAAASGAATVERILKRKK